MNINFSKSFDKQFVKLSRKQQEKVKEVIALFLQDKSTPSIRLHALHGQLQGHYSLSVGGDLRIHFKQIDKKTISFIAVGSHSQLYK